MDKQGNANNLEEICDWCKKARHEDAEWGKHQKSIRDVKNAFSFYVGGQEVTREEYKYITEKKRYITQRFLDGIRRANALWKEFFPGIKRPF